MSVEITAAWYGSEENVTGVSVLDVVKSLQSTGVASFTVSNESMGSDPQLYVLKTLFVTYTVGDETKKVTTVEWETLTFANLV
jgi:hypothetical protein